ncbi:peptide chain release factor 2 [Rodentibacter pneumotropicus]|uniref:Peptide chain release factor 2 n=1 Tax=Rodentibacter pneumotropicus TaxID=758 RepID=A0A448MMS7_9PAST|nr:peptide chain release factor 2 [Rodentibacter pneumotropicus]
MFEINPVKIKSLIFPTALRCFGGIFDFDAKVERLEEVNAELEQPEVWNDPDRAQSLGKERVALEQVVNTIRNLEQGLEDVGGLLELAVEAEDEDTFNEAVAELETLEMQLAQLEFRRMFSGEHDASDCYVDLQAGSGGTEAQDWTEMLLRMYLRWAESKGFKTELMEVSDGDVAGLKSATIKLAVNMPSVGYARKPAFIVWFEKAHSIPITAVIPLSVPYLFILKLMMILTLKSTRQIYVLTFIALPVRVVSTLIKPKVRYESPICQAVLWCSVKMIVLNTKIRIRQ